MTTYVAPICTGCRHFRRGSKPLACTAFPAGIPDDILKSRVDHRQPINGDHGYQFQAIDKEAAEYAALIFDEE